VLRLGKIVAQRPKSELDPQIAVDLMTTGRSDRVAAARPQPGGAV
jgi:hypothetical protein